jgi:hypothetical protein
MRIADSRQNSIAHSQNQLSLRNVFPNSPSLASCYWYCIHGGSGLLGDEPGTPNTVLRTSVQSSDPKLLFGMDSSRLEHAGCCVTMTQLLSLYYLPPLDHGTEDRRDHKTQFRPCVSTITGNIIYLDRGQESQSEHKLLISVSARVKVLAPDRRGTDATRTGEATGLTLFPSESDTCLLFTIIITGCTLIATKLDLQYAYSLFVSC